MNEEVMPIGERMKHNYESTTAFRLTNRTPVIIRVDGKSFHSVTRYLDKPFDKYFMDNMEHAAIHAGLEMQGYKLAYTQSDEINFLLTDYDALTTQGWFDYKLSKILSVSASLVTRYFNLWNGPKGNFDARAFNIPKEEVSNYFLWRSLDWQRNSIQMYSQSFFSHSQLMNKNQIDMHEMLYDIGKNWTKDLGEREKNGAWFISKEITPRYDILPKYEYIAGIIEPLINKSE